MASPGELGTGLRPKGLSTCSVTIALRMGRPTPYGARLAQKKHGKGNVCTHASCGTLLWLTLDVLQAFQAVNCLLTLCCPRKLGLFRLGVYAGMMKYKSLQRERHDKCARHGASQSVSRSYVTWCSVMHTCSTHGTIYLGVLQIVTQKGP